MPRSLVLGNSHLLATFDEHLELRDLYFPFVGMEDHTTYKHRHRVGVLVEGRGFSWLSDGTWKITPRYISETLVGDSRLENSRLGVAIVAQDYVHPVHNVLIRSFRVHSTDGTEKHVRLFFHHDLHLYGDRQKDTAFYEPYSNTVIHYRQTRYFLIGGNTDRSFDSPPTYRRDRYTSILRSMEQLQPSGLSSFTTGKAEYKGLEGTWRDAEDGELTRNPIEQGSVDSTVSLHFLVDSHVETEANLWLCMGKTLDDVLQLHQTVLTETPERLHRNCQNYWKSWVNKTPGNFGSLSPELIELFKRSLLITRTHIDAHGGIVAAADNDIMAFNRDTYTYVWPRDGAFVCLALDRAGYVEVTRQFFRFCCRVQTPDGYLLHKYNPDGSTGSSWHPWYREHEPHLPIQEDETALVLVALHRHFQVMRDFEFLQEMYECFVKRGAQFLCDFREETTGLPLQSYDPWEEHRGVFTYTTACVIAGLHAAADIAHILGHYKHFERYQTAADEMRQALLFHLFDETTHSFLKGIKRRGGATVERDTTPDVSFSVLWTLGVLPVNEPRVVSTMERLQKELAVRTAVGGYARYKGDRYHLNETANAAVPGNPWIITTLWLAQWAIARAKTLADLEPAREALEWTRKWASPAGILPEQLDAETGMHLSVAPLVWSHAAYVETVLKYLEKERILNGDVSPPGCALSRLHGTSPHDA